MLNADVNVESGKMERFSIHFNIRHSALSIAGINKCGSNSVVESQPSKLLVAGSIPVSRSIRRRAPEKQARYDAMPRQSAEGAAAGSLRSRTNSESADVSAISDTRTGTADLSAISGKGTGTADLSAEAPTARRPM